uniref:Uncharacterized protein n=1 Tax=Arundo donax TaxID=35708 RepID=A0A0A9CBK4_ARUDO
MLHLICVHWLSLWKICFCFFFFISDSAIFLLGTIHSTEILHSSGYPVGFPMLKKSAITTTPSYLSAEAKCDLYCIFN